jgi:hypothetical protein
MIGKTIDEIMDDNGIDGLCYERCIWRCNIKRLINENDKSDYLFLAENLTYGTIIQASLTYYSNILKKLNDWLYNLNKTLIKEFVPTELIKTYIFEYDMYSDIFYLEKTKKYALTFYNTNLLETILPTLTSKEKYKIRKNCNKNIELLTYDVLALLNVFKHFIENEDAVQYIKDNRKSF